MGNDAYVEKEVPRAKKYLLPKVGWEWRARWDELGTSTLAVISVPAVRRVPAENKLIKSESNSKYATIKMSAASQIHGLVANTCRKNAAHASRITRSRCHRGVERNDEAVLCSIFISQMEHEGLTLPEHADTCRLHFPAHSSVSSSSTPLDRNL